MAGLASKTVKTLYVRDFFAWTQDQARKLRARARNEIDWENAAEEIASLGRSGKYEIENRMEVLLLRLPKWQYQPEKRASGLRGTIIEQRIRIRRRIEESPSLRDYPAQVLDDAYALARAGAEDETGLTPESLPEICPFDASSVLNSEYWPEAE